MAKKRTAPRSRKPRSIQCPRNWNTKDRKWINLSKDWRVNVSYFDGEPYGACLQHRPCARGKAWSVANMITGDYDLSCYYCGAEPKVRRPSRHKMIIEGKTFTSAISRAKTTRRRRAA